MLRSMETEDWYNCRPSPPTTTYWLGVLGRGFLLSPTSHPDLRVFGEMPQYPPPGEDRMVVWDRG